MVCVSAPAIRSGVPLPLQAVETVPISGTESPPSDRKDAEQRENTMTLHPPPIWIDATTWRELDSDLREALAGSVLAPDGGLDVRAEVYDRICTCFPAPVRDLLHAAHAHAEPPGPSPPVSQRGDLARDLS